jgi:hypothetical protein
MKWLLTSIIIISALFTYLLLSTSENRQDSTDIIDYTNNPFLPKVENTNFKRLNNKGHDKNITKQFESNKHALNLHPTESANHYNIAEQTDNQIAPLPKTDSSNHNKSKILEYSEHPVNLSNTEPTADKLPGEDLNFHLKLYTSTHHMIDGRATSDIGKALFKSRLMASNEIKLSLKLKQSELDDIQLLAYVDLANFTMELDGADSVLNNQHKALMKLILLHLRSKLERQYEDYDTPEHALILIQMLSYWSVSPEGYVHDKRSIVSQ